MSDPNEFTAREKYIISLYKDPALLFRKSLQRTSVAVVLSLGLVVYAFLAADIGCGVFGYALLLFFVISRVIVLKRGLGTVLDIIIKYEARLQANRVAS
ncbi:MAG TPA: hypothetical protein VJT54_10615 [Verrucomicrobiae bacterium]|nr:hypothetical protein [Verrucomicrobiae bacterium]